MKTPAPRLLSFPKIPPASFIWHLKVSIRIQIFHEVYTCISGILVSAVSFTNDDDWWRRQCDYVTTEYFPEQKLIADDVLKTEDDVIVQF